MKIAHLILTHANPEQLGRLIGRLAHPDCCVYVHLDLKTDISAFGHLAKKGRVVFVQNRVKVAWGDYTIVQATINGLEEIMATGIAYEYINLLSGQDYPIKSTEYIHRQLSAQTGKAFMHTLIVATEWQEAITRYTKYHLSYLNFPGSFYVESLLGKLLPDRKFPGNMTPVGRSQWFTISRQHVAYILDFVKKSPGFVRFFKLTWAPDEFFFQTILYNSPHQQEMVNDNMRYIDWSEGKANPKVLTMADADALTATPALYARKFNPAIDSQILDYLDGLHKK
jgi:hypothetical protein